MSDNTVLATVQSVTNQGAGAMVTSLTANQGDRAAAARVFNALNNPSEKVSNHINEVIEVRDYLIEMVEMEKQDAYGNGTGEYEVVPRVVLISPDGTAYQAVSRGMANCLRNLIGCVGNAPWEPAISLKVKQISVGRGSMLTAEMVG